MKRLLKLPLRAGRRLLAFLLRPLTDELAGQNQALAQALQAQGQEMGLHLENLTREVVRLQLQLEALEGLGRAGLKGEQRAA